MEQIRFHLVRYANIALDLLELEWDCVERVIKPTLWSIISPCSHQFPVSMLLKGIDRIWTSYHWSSLLTNLASQRAHPVAFDKDDARLGRWLQSALNHKIRLIRLDSEPHPKKAAIVERAPVSGEKFWF